jgi:hypothetical protein
MEDVILIGPDLRSHDNIMPHSPTLTTILMNPSDSPTLNMAPVIHIETLEEVRYTIQLASEPRKHKQNASRLGAYR